MKVTKDFTGRPNDEWLDTDEFKFALKADENHAKTKTALDAGQIVMPTEATLSVNKTNKNNAYFGNIRFTKAGTYQFIVTEQDNGLAGVTYDTTPRTVIVTVVDNWDGTLTATANGLLTFTNVYGASGTLEGNTNLKVTKNFTGRQDDEWLTTDSFTFVLESADEVTTKAIEAGYVVMPADKDGITIDSITSGKTKAFGDIRFTKEGTYKFIIREVKPTSGNAIHGVEYDGTAREITVTVKDNGDATMNVTSRITSGTNLTFKNVYTPDETTLSGHNNLHVVKNLTGREWLDTDAFTFILTADTSNSATKAALDDGKIVMPERSKITVTKDNKDRVHFGDITFKKDGTYQFIVTEQTSNIAGVTDDADVDRIVIVEVKHDYDDNTLIASIADKSEVTTLEDGRKAVSFTNTYNAGSATLDGDTYLEVTKKLTGRDWFDTDEFTFTLEATDDATRAVLPASEQITIKGTAAKKAAAFSDITFTKPGNYNFVIKETKGTLENVTYDTHEVKVTVVVTDNHKGQLVAATPVYSGSMEFKNVYTPEPVRADIKG